MARGINVKITGDARSYERALKKASSATDKFGKKMKRTLTGGGAKSILKAGGLGALFGGAGVVGLGIGAGVSSVKAVSNFEATMQRIQGLAGQSAQQVAQWSEDLIALGPAIGKSPQELAEALYFIASSGVPASKALDTLRVSAKAASAGLGETQVVADAVTSVMNAYATSGMTAAHATDTLVAIVREGKGEADEFAGVIGNVAAFASKLNVPFEQVGAALAAMTQLGTDPRTAATQLQAFFSQILKVSEPMQKKANRLGLPDLFDQLQTKLTSGNLLGALRQLKGLSALQLSQIFPNVRAVRAALALVERGGGRVAGIFKRMGITTGSAKRSFAAYAKTSKHHMEQLSASIEALKITFGQGLAPVVSKAAQALAQKFANPQFVAKVRKLGFLIGTTLYNAFMNIKAWFDKNGPTIMAWINGFASAISKIAGALKWLDKHKGPSGKSLWDKASSGGLNPFKDGKSGDNKAPAQGGNIDLYIDGQKVANVVVKRQQRKGKSNAGSRRGRNPGGSVGLLHH